MTQDSDEREPLVKKSHHSKSRSRQGRGHEAPINEPFRSPSQSPERSHRAPSESPSSSSSSSVSEKPNPLLILPLNFFNAFGWSLIEVPLIYLLRTRICELRFGDVPGSLPYETDKCRTDAIQMSVSGIRAGFQTIAAVLGLLTTTSYGSISDSQGRRKVLLICSVFHLVGDLSLLGIVMLPGYTNPYWVLIAAVFKGFGGYISAVVASQNSYVADCTTSDNRSRYLGWNFATYHLGTAAGPLISGVLVAKYDRMDLVYAISVTLWGLYFLYTYFILPESNPPENVESDDGADLYSLASEGSAVDVVKSRMQRLGTLLYDHFVEPLAIVLPSRTKTTLDFLGPSTEAKRHWDVCVAALLIGLTLFSTGSMGMLPLYTDYKLKWGSLKASLLMSVDAGASAVTLTLFFPFVCWAFGKFLKRFGGFSSWDDLGITIPWLSSQDPDQPPSNFYPGIRPYKSRPEQSKRTSQRNNRFQNENEENALDDRAAQFKEVSKKITVVKRDLWVARTGYLAAAIAVAGVAMAKNDAEMYISIIVQSLSNIALPAVQSIALNGVRSEYNGRILAGFAIVESLALVVRGPVFAGIYSLTLSKAPNAIYWTSSGVYLLCLLVLGVVKLYRPLGSSQ